MLTGTLIAVVHTKVYTMLHLGKQVMTNEHHQHLHMQSASAEKDLSFTESFKDLHSISRISWRFGAMQVRDDMKALYTNVMPSRTCTDEQKAQILISLAQAHSNARAASTSHDDIANMVCHCDKNCALAFWCFCRSTYRILRSG